MAELTVLHQGKETVIQFEGNPLLGDILAEAGFRIPRPCGGRGICGKCAVDVKGSISAPDPEEQAMGVRLACRTILTGDAEVILPEERTGEQIQTEGSAAVTMAGTGSGAQQRTKPAPAYRAPVAVRTPAPG